MSGRGKGTRNRNKMSNDQYFQLRMLLPKYVDSDGVIGIKPMELLTRFRATLEGSVENTSEVCGIHSLNKAVNDAGYRFKGVRAKLVTVKDLVAWTTGFEQTVSETARLMSELEKTIGEVSRRQENMAAYIKRRLPGEEND